MKLSEYVAQVINDPKYGHDIGWVKGNLHRAHIEQIEAAHDAEVRAEERERAALHAEEGYRMEEHCDDIAKRIRSGEPAEIAARPGVVPEEPEGEHVFIERYGMHHAKFGGIGGDVTSLGLTREAWKAMGEPDVLAVSYAPAKQEDQTTNHEIERQS